MLFEKVKLGKRTEIDCERFQEAVRHISVMKSVTYQDLILSASKGRVVKRESVAPPVILGGGRPGTTTEYANKLRHAVSLLELRASPQVDFCYHAIRFVCYYSMLRVGTGGE